MYGPDLSIDSAIYSNLESDELKEIIQDDDKFEEIFKELALVLCYILLLFLPIFNKNLIIRGLKATF